jgi:hypothetical protein
MTDIQMQQISQVYKTFRMDFGELDLNPAIVEDYIGFIPGSSPDPFPEIIEDILATAGKTISPMGGYAVFDNIIVDPANNKIAVQDIVFASEDIVTNHMVKAESLAVYACTAGDEITRMAAEYNRNGSPVHAYIADSLGSIIVERAMDIIQEHLKSTLAEKGLQITNRYNPGYCGWETREQKLLFSLLPDSFCGITLTDSLLMKPIKSVSGIIGIGKNVTYDHYTCNYCKDINCPYRGKR